MVLRAIGDVLPIALMIAVSPLALITGIVLLLADRGPLKASMFAVGWMSSVTIITTIAWSVSEVYEDDDQTAATNGVKVVTLLIGTLFLVMAFVAWRRRPRAGDPPSESALLGRVTRMSALAALGLGFAEGIIVFKNIPLAIGAGATVALDTQRSDAGWIALVVFAVLSGSGILITVLTAVLGGTRLAPQLVSLRHWLEDNISPITVVTLVVVGIYFVSKGLTLL